MLEQLLLPVHVKKHLCLTLRCAVVIPAVVFFWLLEAAPNGGDACAMRLACREGVTMGFTSGLQNTRDAAMFSPIPAATGDPGQKFPGQLVAAYSGLFFILIIIAGAGIAIMIYWRRKSNTFNALKDDTQLRSLIVLKKYEHLFKYARNIILICGPNGNIISANDQAMKAYGYTAGELFRQSFSSLMAPAFRSEASELSRFKNEGDGGVYEAVHCRKDGSMFSVEVSIQVFEIQGVTFYQAFIRDITEQKDAERKMTSANRMYSVISQINQAIVRVQDEDALFSAVCTIAVEFGGFCMTWIARADAAAGLVRPVAHAGSEESSGDDMASGIYEDMQCPVATAVREGTYVVCDDFADASRSSPWCEKGRVFGCRSLIALPLIKGGKRIGVFVLYSYENHIFADEELDLLLVVSHDISFVLEFIEQQSARKRVEEGIRILNEKLERMVRERTAELESANNELQTFSYSVSHELRSPLRAIDGFGRLIEKDYADLLDAKGKRLIDIIRKSTRQMDQLINDLLDFSRLGKKELTQTEIDMHELALSSLDQIQKENSGRRVESIIRDLPAARGDMSMMRQVFINLLANAYKFTRKSGDPRIRIGSYAEGDETVYFVRDNGAGFDMKYAHKLFGVFSRLHSDDQFEGTGIGLALVQRIINRHGGRVWAEGAENKGATIYFSLPRREGTL